MAAGRDLDGRIAQGWGGTAPNGVHLNVILARRGTPTAAAMITAFTAPSPGYTPILACLGRDQPSYETLYPPTILVNKVAATDERQETLLAGAVQVGVARAVLDAVAVGHLEADQETTVLVSVYLDPAAESEPAVLEAARHAAGQAIAEAVEGRPPEAVQRHIDDRDEVTHPYYGRLRRQ